MKITFSLIMFLCFVMAATATPASIIYGIYLWAISDTAFKLAIWGAAKLWMLMIAMIIPGLLIYAGQK